MAKVDGPLVREMAVGPQLVLVDPRKWTAQLRRVARVKRLAYLAPHVERHIAHSVLAALKPDMLYASTVLSSEYIAAAQGLSVPCVLHVHEQEPLTSWALTRSGARSVGLAVIAASPFVAEELKRLGCKVVAVLPGPVDIFGVDATLDEPSLWSSSAYKVLLCGSVAPWKGPGTVLDLAESIPMISGRVVEWVWIGAGDAETLTLEAARRGLGTRVRWVGERANPRPHMQHADVLVMPSEQESLGLVALEAAAVGTPTVGFSVGGLPGVLRDPRALAIPGDTRDLALKIAEVLRDR